MRRRVCNYPMDAGYHGGRPGYGYNDLQKRFAAFPSKVVDAKLRRLVDRGLLSGCAGHHDCQGDFEVGAKGWKYLMEREPDTAWVERLRQTAITRRGF